MQKQVIVMGIMSSITGGLAVTLLITALLMYGNWQAAKVEIVSLKSQVKVLEMVNERNSITIDGLITNASNSADTVKELGERNEKIMVQATESLQAINNLRLTEAEAARKAPLSRGYASYDRIVSHLLRYSGDVSGGLHTDNAGASVTD